MVRSMKSMSKMSAATAILADAATHDTQRKLVEHSNKVAEVLPGESGNMSAEDAAFRAMVIGYINTPQPGKVGSSAFLESENKENTERKEIAKKWSRLQETKTYLNPGEKKDLVDEKAILLFQKYEEIEQKWFDAVTRKDTQDMNEQKNKLHTAIYYQTEAFANLAHWRFRVSYSNAWSLMSMKDGKDEQAEASYWNRKAEAYDKQTRLANVKEQMELQTRCRQAENELLLLLIAVVGRKTFDKNKRDISAEDIQTLWNRKNFYRRDDQTEYQSFEKLRDQQTQYDGALQNFLKNNLRASGYSDSIIETYNDAFTEYMNQKAESILEVDVRNNFNDPDAEPNYKTFKDTLEAKLPKESQVIDKMFLHYKLVRYVNGLPDDTRKKARKHTSSFSEDIAKPVWAALPDEVKKTMLVILGGDGTDSSWDNSISRGDGTDSSWDKSSEIVVKYLRDYCCKHTNL